MTLGVAAVGLDVRLVELLAVEAVVAVSFRPRLAGKGDDPLDEDAARPLRLSCEICTYSGFVLSAGTERLGQEALSAAVGRPGGRSPVPCALRRRGIAGVNITKRSFSVRTQARNWLRYKDARASVSAAVAKSRL
jgi:hypothetical protein